MLQIKCVKTCQDIFPAYALIILHLSDFFTNTADNVVRRLESTYQLRPCEIRDAF